jgi:hypothetical protein
MSPLTGLFRFAVVFYKDFAPTALEMVQPRNTPNARTGIFRVVRVFRG